MVEKREREINKQSSVFHCVYKKKVSSRLLRVRRSCRAEFYWTSGSLVHDVRLTRTLADTCTAQLCALKIAPISKWFALKRRSLKFAHIWSARGYTESATWCQTGYMYTNRLNGVHASDALHDVDCFLLPSARSSPDLLRSFWYARRITYWIPL